MEGRELDFGLTCVGGKKIEEGVHVATVIVGERQRRTGFKENSISKRYSRDLNSET